MLEPMRRGRSRVLWRYTPQASYRYSDGGPWCRTAEIYFANAEGLDSALAQALDSALGRWGAVEQRMFPSPVTQAVKYVTGEPGSVFFTLWPLVFRCKTRSCQTIHYYRDLDSLQSSNSALRCRECHRVGRASRLQQIPYVFVCLCGRIETPYVPPCRVDARHPIELIDRKGFRESFWRCKTCKTNVLPGKNVGLGFRKCSCGRTMRGMRLDDPQCYYAQTLNVVAIESHGLNIWKRNDRFDLFLAGSALELPCHERRHINDLASRQDATDPNQAVVEKTLRESLQKSGLSDLQIQKVVADLAAATGADVWRSYEKDIARFETLYLTADFARHRQTVEYVFVRDDKSCAPLSLDELLDHARDSADTQAQSRHRRELDLARTLGIRRLELIQELPLILAAYGYTRLLSGPFVTSIDAGGAESHASLRSFEPVDGKLPIYTAKNSTEALLFEIDPAALAAFLALNLEIELPVHDKDDASAWKAWLLETCPALFKAGEAHLRLFDAETQRGEEVSLPAALAFGVLHSLSHALKNTAHKFVGIDGDALAEYLFPAYASGLIYASANVEFTLGGIDSVFRSNLIQWLAAVRDYAGLCSFDPVCGSSGGACHACMYPKFGCQFFNRTVSRSFLVGGIIDGLERPIYGLWSHEVQELLARLGKEAAA